MAKDTAPPSPTQRANERSRLVVDGKRTDDGGRCELLAVHEVGGTWALYPHGWPKMGVRLADEVAVRLAQAILAGKS